jgi:hypothetical protein
MGFFCDALSVLTQAILPWSSGLPIVALDAQVLCHVVKEKTICDAVVAVCDL